MGTYGNPPTYKNWGHVVAWIPGAGFLSSPGQGYGQQWFGSIEEIERYFRCTFVGWSEDINDLDVMDWIDDGGTPPEPSQRTYTVVPGDTLWGIAVLFYGDGTRYPEIAAYNGIENPNLIFPGQTFIIP
jgi:nucleoid-associated protein YgaU